MGFFNNIISSLKQASRKRVELNKQTNTLQLLLDTSSEEYFTLSFKSMKIQELYDPSILDAYSLECTSDTLGSLYIEVIRLKRDHQWRANPSSAFDQLIKHTFRSSELRFVDSFEDGFSKLSRYKVDHTHDIATIWFSLNQYEVFILDTKGQLFNDLLNIYDTKNETLFISSLESFDILPTQSIVTSNMIEDHFGKDN